MQLTQEPTAHESAGALVRSSARTAESTGPKQRARAKPLVRLAEADVLRAAAVVGVVVVHAASWPSTSTQLRYNLWHAVILLARFSVPAFVVLTGLLLEYNRRPAANARAFLRRRGARSVVPWVAWAGAYTVFGMAVQRDIGLSPAGVTTFLMYGAGHL